MKIDKKNLIIFLVFLVIEIFIAIFIHDNFIRPFIGDLLVVILMYFFIQVFYRKNRLKVIIGIFLFGIIMEILQYLNLIELLNIQDKILKIIIGSVFDWKDILAYGIGCLILVFNHYLGRKKIAKL